MKKKILKTLFVCLAFVFIFSFTVLPTFAYTSVNGWYDFAPNMPDMQLFYKRPGYSANPYPRTLTGYVSYTGSLFARQSDNGNSMSTFKSNDALGYTFNTFYAAEVFLDFNYLPFSSSSNHEEGLFSVELDLLFTTDTMDSSADNTVTVRVGYYNDSNVISSKTFSYDFWNDYTRNLNLYDILNDDSAYGLAYLQIGFDFSGKEYDESKYVVGTILISDLETWIANDPFVNSSQNLYTLSYDRGFADAVEQLGGAVGEDFYNRGYSNGYNAGRLDGYNEGFSQATQDNANANYENGYQAGYNAGYQTYASYAETEYVIQYNKGYDEGFLKGQEVYEGSGYQEGYWDGEYEGFFAGEEYGYNLGYYDGVNESIEEMGLFNYIISSITSFLNIPLGDYFTLGGLLTIVISIPLLIACLKLFAGG